MSLGEVKKLKKYDLIISSTYWTTKRKFVINFNTWGRMESTGSVNTVFACRVISVHP